MQVGGGGYCTSPHSRFRCRMDNTRAQMTVYPSFGSRRLGTFKNLRTIVVSIKKQRIIIFFKTHQGPN